MWMREGVHGIRSPQRPSGPVVTFAALRRRAWKPSARAFTGPSVIQPSGRASYREGVVAGLGAVLLGFGVTFLIALASTASYRRNPARYRYHRSMERGRRSTFGLGVSLSRRPALSWVVTGAMMLGGVVLLVVGW